MTLKQHVDAVVERAIAERRIVGAVLIVRQHGELLHESAYGLIDREANRPMMVDAIFRLSSLTKPIVAATILALKDQGLLALTDPVTKFLPDFRLELPDGSAPVITIEHLLTHTSGLNTAPLASVEELSAEVSPWRMGTEAMMARIAERPLMFAPGTGFAYGPSIDVLGVIAGQLVDGSLEDAMRRTVLDPLGMVDTRFLVTDMSRLATPYADGKAGAERMGDVHSVPAPWGGFVTYDPKRIFDAEAFQSGGGGAAGTARDFMQLLEALRKGGGGVLKPETVTEGLGNHTPQLQQASGPGWQFSHFGAWLEDAVLAEYPAARGTNRWGGIYGHSWFFDPSIGLSVVSMTNTGLEGCDGAYRHDICKAVYAGLS